MTTGTWKYLATVEASTLRIPAEGGDPVTRLTTLKVVPLQPVSTDVAQQFNFSSLRESLVTYADGIVDVQSGDVLVIGTEHYPIQYAGKNEGRVSVTAIFVEDVK